MESLQKERCTLPCRISSPQKGDQITLSWSSAASSQSNIVGKQGRQLDFHVLLFPVCHSIYSLYVLFSAICPMTHFYMPSDLPPFTPCPSRRSECPILYHAESSHPIYSKALAV